MEHNKQTTIRIALIIFGIALLMFWCFMAFIGHGWVQAPINRVLIDAGLFFLAPLLGWYSWRGSKAAGIMLYGSTIFILWLPPWVIVHISYMLLITLVMIIFGLSLRTIESRIQQGTPGDAKTARPS